MTHADLSEAARLDAASDAEPDLCAGVAASVATANDHKRRPQNWREIEKLKSDLFDATMDGLLLEATVNELRAETAELAQCNLRQARTIFEQADIIARRWKWLAFVGVTAWLVGAVMGRAWA